MNGSMRIVVAAAGVVLWGGCGESPVEPRRELVAAFIVDREFGPEIDAPDHVVTGEDIVVKVTTYGNGCFAKGETRVQSEGDVVVISPFDYFTSQGSCPDIFLTFDHEATIPSDDLSHRAVIVVQGRRTQTGDLLTTEIREVVIEQP